MWSIMISLMFASVIYYREKDYKKDRKMLENIIQEQNSQIEELIQINKDFRK